MLALLKSRKGAFTFGSMALFFIASMILVTIMFLTLFNVNLEQQQGSIECVDGVYHEIMMAKLLTAPSCFIYEDEDLGRAIPGTIDLDKFTQDNLDSCFPYLGINQLQSLISVESYTDTHIQITLGDTTIGSEIDDPQTFSKNAYVYSEGETNPETITFSFEVPLC